MPVVIPETLTNHQLELILRAVKAQRSLIDLREQGVLYHNIVRLLNQAVQDGLVDFGDDDNPIITEAGLDYLEDCSESVTGGSSRWIEPANDKRRPKRDASDVYVPNRAVIMNLRG